MKNIVPVIVFTSNGLVYGFGTYILDVQSMFCGFPDTVVSLLGSIKDAQAFNCYNLHSLNYTHHCNGVFLSKALWLRLFELMTSQEKMLSTIEQYRSMPLSNKVLLFYSFLSLKAF